MSPRDLTVGDLASSLSSRGLVATGGRVLAVGIVARVQHARALAVTLDPWRERARSLRLAGSYRALRDLEEGEIERRVYDAHRLDAELEAHVLGAIGAARDADLVSCPACRGSGEAERTRAPYRCPETGWLDDEAPPCGRCEGRGELPRHVLEREARS